MQSTVYNIQIVKLVEKLKEIYLSGCDMVNISLSDENTIRLAGVERNTEEEPNIEDYI